MVKLKKNNNVILVIALAVVVFVLLKGGPGIMSFITTCDNNEPATMADWEAYAAEKNATLTTLEPYAYESGNLTITYQQSRLTTSNDTWTITQTPGGCQKYIDVVRSQGVNQTTTMTGTHKITIVDDNNYWCNHDEGMALQATTLISVNHYYEEFENCTRREINTSINTPEYEVVTKTPPIMNPTPVSNEEETITIEWLTNLDKTTIIVIAILALLVLYFAFEAGPDKGLFRGKRK